MDTCREPRALNIHVYNIVERHLQSTVVRTKTLVYFRVGPDDAADVNEFTRKRCYSRCYLWDVTYFDYVWLLSRGYFRYSRQVWLFFSLSHSLSEKKCFIASTTRRHIYRWANNEKLGENFLASIYSVPGEILYLLNAKDIFSKLHFKFNQILTETWRWIDNCWVYIHALAIERDGRTLFQGIRIHWMTICH